MRQEERLLIIAHNEQATNTCVEILMSLCADYIEGEQDWAGVIFNRYFSKMYPEVQKKFIHTCPFEKLANKMAKKYGFALPWRETSENPWEWEYKGFERNPRNGQEVYVLQVVR